MNAQYLPTVRQLQAFLAVYKLGRLGAAAEQLFVTQSAVSVLIKQLESGLKVRLFERTTRSLTPTAAAHDALITAERILRDLEALAGGFGDVRDLKRGSVSLVITPTLASLLLPAAVTAFSSQHPDIRLSVSDCAPDQFLARVVGEQVDFGIGTPEHAGDEVELRTLLRDHLALVCRADHPLAKLRRVRWTDLRDHPLIAGRPGYGVRQLVDLTAAAAGVRLRVVGEISFQSTALWMTESGMGPAIMPSAYAQQSHSRKLIVKTLQQPKVPRDVYIVTKKGRHLSPACQAFLEVLLRSVAPARTPAAGAQTM